jgi:hypothetical protein
LAAQPLELAVVVLRLRAAWAGSYDIDPIPAFAADDFSHPPHVTQSAGCRHLGIFLDRELTECFDAEIAGGGQQLIVREDRRRCRTYA